MEEDMSDGTRVAAWFVLLRPVRWMLALIPAAVAALGLCIAAAEQAAAPEPEEEFGEFLARPAELASVPVNDIAKSLRLNGGAMSLGKKVYAKACASCHGADLKGLPDQHTPDLTDAEWR